MERAVDIWMRQRQERLLAALGPRDILYGEWLWHRVSIPYTRLPALCVGIAWQRGERVLPFRAAHPRLERAGVFAAVPIFAGRLGSLRKLRTLVGRSSLGEQRMEGVIVERVGRGWPRWAKWVDDTYAHPTTGELSGARNTSLME